MSRVAVTLNRDLGKGAFDLAQIVAGQFDARAADVLFSALHDVDFLPPEASA